MLFPSGIREHLNTFKANSHFADWKFIHDKWRGVFGLQGRREEGLGMLNDYFSRGLFVSRNTLCITRLSKVFQYCQGEDPGLLRQVSLGEGEAAASVLLAQVRREAHCRLFPLPCLSWQGLMWRCLVEKKMKSLLLPTEPKRAQWRNCGSIHTVSGLFKVKNISAAV